MMVSTNGGKKVPIADLFFGGSRLLTFTTTLMIVIVAKGDACYSSFLFEIALNPVTFLQDLIFTFGRARSNLGKLSSLNEL